jgi:UDP-GlcNAc:undecaprenyl-phosphate GlcNAc-1-phosphate transferase
MIGKYTAVNPVAVLAPVLILGVPVFDTLFVMYVRRLRGISVFLGSSDHFALRLRQWALSVPQVVVVIYGAAFVLGGVALLLMRVSTKTALALVGTTMTLALVAAVWLKRIDMSKPAERAFQREPSPESARSAP